MVSHSKAFSSWESVFTNLTTLKMQLEHFKKLSILILMILSYSITWDCQTLKLKAITRLLIISKNVLSWTLNTNMPITIWRLCTTCTSYIQKQLTFVDVPNWIILRAIIVTDIGHLHCLKREKWERPSKRLRKLFRKVQRTLIIGLYGASLWEL